LHLAPRGVVGGRDQRDGRCRAGDVLAACPDSGEEAEPIAISDHDEVPRLGVLRRWRSAGGFENLIEIGAGDWPIGVLPDVAPGSDRIAGTNVPAGLILISGRLL
jgi:hypothetical protein